MIIIKKHIYKGLPFLEVVKEELANEVLPTVFVYHGWTNTKEVVLVNGYEIAQRNMRGILPEAMFHGERSDGLSVEEHFQDFARIVLHSVEEFRFISEYLVENKLTDSEKIGVTGLSMGGITTCAIMTRYPQVKAADCLMGAPNLHGFVENVAKVAMGEEQLPVDFDAQLSALDPYDLSLQPEKINQRPFHFWHGTADDMVPYEPTHAFYEKIKATNEGENLTFTTTEGGHKVPYNITLEMADFFEKVL